MGDDVLLTLEDVVAGYKLPVVGPVSFRVNSGDIIGLGGPNGIGKSTILRAITGVASVFSGDIVRKERLKVAHQWQRPAIPPEIALLGRELFALKGADVDSVPDRVKPLLDKPLHSMSGGQFQLVQSLACLCGSAHLVLLDEPTNNMDVTALETLSYCIKNKTDSRALLLVSHEQDFLRQHCTSFVVLS